MTNAAPLRPAVPEGGAPPPAPASGWRQSLGDIARRPVALASAVVLLLVVLAAAAGPWIVPYAANDIDLGRALQAPSWAHVFGTDDLGRDIYSRVVLAAGVSVQVSVVSVSIAFAAGVLLGLIAGYFGGWIDTIVMRIVDVMFAFPVLLLALAIVAILGPGLTTAMIAIGVVYVPIFARVARASTLSVREEPFVRAAQGMGAGSRWIILRHILPNVAAPLIVQTSLSLAFAILSEAALSFLGLGVQPPNPSWGRMLFDARGYLDQAWWMAVFPGLAVFVTVLAFNLLGDTLRDVLDPSRREVRP
ncbi:MULTISPECIES: ABC transporter permease [Microcella]|uniref:ABC transporter permease n=1 Tax=Microcella TaxID=337004 RepID=UPI0015CF1ABC|nr:MULTISPECIES: ABC transporter permease [Microcella]QOD93096.1 ABC transporter permease [Chryseoglobus sp. 28M-23]